jgi:hypothetical protein
MSIRVVSGEGVLDQLGLLGVELGFSRALIVADKGIVAAGFVDRAALLLDAVGIVPFFFHNFDANPDTAMVEAGREYAAAGRVDGIVALGGGSSLDCAKGINFVLTNGGSMRDYRGHGKASKPMLPSIGIPTTAGTGSEAQSFAIISDAETHAKMACGDEKAAFRIVLLDPALTVSQPRSVTAIAGYDALSHAVEAYVTKNRSPRSWRSRPGGCSSPVTSASWPRRATSRPAARCCAAPIWPAPRSSCRCSAPPTRAPIRSPRNTERPTASPSPSCSRTWSAGTPRWWGACTRTCCRERIWP